MAAVQFAVTPSFGHHVFTDNDRVESVLSAVLKERSKQDAEGQILNAITQTGSQTVGDLRRFTDHDWRSLAVPAICRIYIMYMVRQSARYLTQVGGSAPSPPPKTPLDLFLQQLANDFNYGQPFDMAQYSEALATMAEMGYKTEDAMEALCIADNKNIQRAIDLLTELSASERARRREEAAVRLGRRAPSLTGGSNSGSGSNSTLLRVSTSSNSSSARSPSPTTLSPSIDAMQLASLREQLERERAARAKAEQDLKAHQSGDDRRVYMDFLRSLVAEEGYTLAEYHQLKLQREKKKISTEEHTKMLAELGVTQAQFDAMRKFDANQVRKDSECVVCLDKPKSHVIMNCMHVCLCDDCVPGMSKKDARCPMCSKKVSKISRIYL